MGETLSDETVEPNQRGSRAVPHLFRVLAAHAPLERSSRHALIELDGVELGRGERVGARREGARLRIDVADGWASQVHARLTRSIGRWQIEDLGSKNSTRINGARVTTAFLADGDVIEVGRTFFVFKNALEIANGAALDSAPVEPLPGIITLMPAFADALAQVARIAQSTTPIVVTGQTGTGKEMIAQGVHAASGRSGRFVPVNCGALPGELVESTLFGHRRGAFSGALDDEPGLLRIAHGGTFFLDEIGDLPLPAQAALLRVLQDHEVTPVGGTRALAVDLRVICATHRDLATMTAAGTFRTDLWHRLKGFSIGLPPLIERYADLGELVRASITRLAGERAVTLHPAAARALFVHRWPGNVRELVQVLGAALTLAKDGRIGAEHLPIELVNTSAPVEPPQDARRDELASLLAEHRGSVRAVARALGKDPVQIRRWLRRYGLTAASFR